MNILVTLDANYIRPLSVMLHSLVRADDCPKFDLYIAHSSLTDENIDSIFRGIDRSRFNVHSIRLSHELNADAPTEDRITKETYYRLTAHEFLPAELDRILYIDPDTLILNSISDLYNMDLDCFCFAGASHTFGVVEDINHIRLGMPEGSRYINAGILMMNLDELRRSYTSKELFDYIDKNADKLYLGDQDVINALYCTKTRYVSPEIYNLDEKTALHSLKTHEWIEKNCSIVHYNGKYKPWKERRIKRKARLKIEFSRGSSRLSTKTSLFPMISVEGDFVRTWRYGRRRIRHKARKYRRFGGFKRNHSWLKSENFNAKRFYSLCDL